MHTPFIGIVGITKSEQPGALFKKMPNRHKLLLAAPERDANNNPVALRGMFFSSSSRVLNLAQVVQKEELSFPDQLDKINWKAGLWLGGYLISSPLPAIDQLKNFYDRGFRPARMVVSIPVLEQNLKTTIIQLREYLPLITDVLLSVEKDPTEEKIELLFEYAEAIASEFPQLGIGIWVDINQDLTQLLPLAEAMVDLSVVATATEQSGLADLQDFVSRADEFIATY